VPLKETAMDRSRRMTRSPRPLAAALATAWLLAAAGAGAQEADSSYGFVRTLEGAATLLEIGGQPPAQGDRTDLEVNAPVLDGDRVWVTRGSRLELVLPDRSLLRLDGSTEVSLDRLAYSRGGDARSTRLRLERGELQLVVPEDALGDELPRLDTANATLYVEAAGSFLVHSDGERWTEVVVRDGALEVLTPRGTRRVRRGERLEVDGDEWPEVALDSAGPEAALERWGRALDGEIATADLRYVDSRLRYAAGGLADRGSWHELGGQWAWRPRVDNGWRPYTDGYWTPTPAGLTWVSYEPWGWATYHYGSWDHVPGWGWVWYPGRVFSPAWVYWYWGPTHVGWCPTGYYSRFYSRAHRFGIHGWAGGRWDAFADWTFCDTERFWRRGLRGHAWSGRDLRHRSRLDAVPRGLITTDTRGLRPGIEGRPHELVEVVRRARGTRPTEGGAELPDVTEFVARRRELSPDVNRAVLEAPGDGGEPGTRLRVTDESPAVLARPRARASTPVDSQAPRALRPDAGGRRDEARPIRVPDGRAGEVGEPAGEAPAVAVRPRAVRPADRPEGWRDEGSPRRATPIRPAPADPVDDGEAGEARRVLRPRPDEGAGSDGDSSGVRSRPSSGARSRGRDDAGDAGRDGDAAAIRRAAPRPTEAWRDTGARARIPAPSRPTAIRPAPEATPRREPREPRQPVVRRVVEGIRDGASRGTQSPRAAPPPAAVRSAPARPSAAAAPEASRSDRGERRGAAAQRSRERRSRDDGDRP
jgi:hypothetical protein